ncbi:Glycosyl transferase group 1 [Thiocapsa sp. KS1]|nr:Glycosyl transferase group 1 [Thiocapsa sp. KS1]
MTARTWRIAVLNPHPIQYFAPLYAYLNTLEDFEVTALYCSDFSLRGAKDPGFGQTFRWDLDLLTGYKSVFLGDRARTRVPAGFWSLICPEVWRAVRTGAFDALILHGQNYAVNFVALAAAKTAGIRVFMRGETHLGLERGRLKAILRRPTMNLLYHLCDACLAIGSANSDFYRAMGVPTEKIFMVPYSVDNERFISQSKINTEERAQVLTSFGLPVNHPVILYASKFQRRKHPDDVLRAAGELQKKGIPSSVLMVGSGEMEGELKDLARSQGIANTAFTGFVNQSDLPKVYGASDVFVLPSENEPWGLVVNEVMCAGLPVVVASEVGCVLDLVKDGDNGYTYPAGDYKALAASLERILENPGLRVEMGLKSRERIRGWSYRECAIGLRRALTYPNNLMLT